MDLPITPRRPALSPSRAADFKQCPLLYRFRAIDRLPEPTSTAQLRGSLVHAALEELYGLPARERIPETAHSLVGPAWDRVLAAEPDLAETVTLEQRAVLLRSGDNVAVAARPIPKGFALTIGDGAGEVEAGVNQDGVSAGGEQRADIEFGDGDLVA